MKELRELILVSLKNVKHFTIKRYYNSCMRKIDSYREGVEYGFLQKNSLSSRQTLQGKKDVNC